MIKVYLATSIMGASRDLKLARRVADYIKSLGHEVLTENVVTKYWNEDIPPEEVFERDIRLLNSSDALIADVTNPSLGVGYEICMAVEKKKPVMVFAWKGVKVSKLIEGNPYLKFVRLESFEELKGEISSFLEHVTANTEEIK